MIQYRFRKHISEQNWFAVSIDLFVVVCLVFLWTQASLAAPLDDISKSMLTRLEAAELVAEAKYAAGRPVEDLVREATVIEKAVGFAAAYQVDAGFARQFFQAQMDANKSVQSTLIKGWQTAGRVPLDNPPNLAVEVRPIYDALTPKLLAELSASLPILAGEDGCNTLREAVKKQQGHKYYAAFEIAIIPLRDVVPGGCAAAE